MTAVLVRRPSARPFGPSTPTAAAITGMGAVTALGLDARSTWRALERGENGIRKLERFSTEGFTSELGATVELEAPSAFAFALRALREALEQAGLLHNGRVRTTLRVGMVLGTSLGSARTDLAKFVEEIASAVELVGPRVVLSTACSSSTHAVGMARDWLASGFVDVALAGGADELSPEIYAGFSALGVVSPTRCAPFSEPVGTSLGEGAGFVVLETIAGAAARGAEVIAYVRGYGLSADAHHATSPDPTGAGVARALRAALEDAGMGPAEVDYVNAHGTGTAANDHAEYRAISVVLGARDVLTGAQKLPWISSSKSFLGHAQGAAGVLELVITLLGMQARMLPCTASFTTARPRCPADPVAGDRPRPHAFDTALSASAAFGGANASVIVSRQPGTRQHSSRRLHVSGMSLWGPQEHTIESLVAALAKGEAPRVQGRAQVIDPRHLRGLDPRGLDLTTTLLIMATRAALTSAQRIVRADTRDRIGLFVGQTRVSPAAHVEFYRSIEQRGLARLNATAFAKMVLNAAGGATTRALDLRGATAAISSGASTGCAVVALGADYLSTHTDLDQLVVAGVHELSDDDGPEQAEGACALVLCACEEPACSARGPRVARWMVDAERLVPHGALDADRVAPEAGAFGGVLACALAVQATLSGAGPQTVSDTRGTLRATISFE